MQSLPYWRLSGFYFFHFAFIGAFAPYWSLYLKSLSFNALQIGVLMSLLHVTRIFAPTAWGYLADHTGKRMLIVQLAAITIPSLNPNTTHNNDAISVASNK